MFSMNVVAIIQARMRSTRLEGKVLKEISGRPMLGRIVDRVRKAREVNEVVVATSDIGADDPVADYCRAQDIFCFRGSEDDVLDRFYKTLAARKGDVAVRITADCPLVDPGLIDRIVGIYRKGGYDYVTNVLRYTYPDGLDVEVVSREALEKAWREATKKSEREHVTAHIRFSNRFRVFNVESDPDLSTKNYRWTVDNAGDLDFIRKIYENLSDGFGYQDVLSLLDRKPELLKLQGNAVINEGYFKTLYTQAKAGAAPKPNVKASQEWLERARKVVPGASQTFSKGTSQFVQGVSPVFLQKGKGCRVWDVDGNEYVDFIQGLLPNILGYAHEEVNAAYSKQLGQGHSFSLPNPLEVQLAEKLTKIIPCAERVRFGKNGSDATAGSVRAARAFTGRERVACCGYHGWQDWYIGSTTRNAGVPQAVRGLTHPFPYNDLAKLEALLKEYPGQFAAVIMEPVNFSEPQPGYLEGVRKLAHDHGALLIFDEICTGFHLGLGGAQKRFGVKPDLAAFGKAMGNGFPISCVVGRADVMAIFEEIFFSFTFGGEVASMAAALKVIEILEGTDALAQMESNGRRLQDGFNTLAREAGLSSRLKCMGYPQWALLKFFDAEGKDSLLVRSLFQQEVVKRGILILVTHNMTGAHDASAIEQTLEAYASVFKTLAAWLSDPNPSKYLEGPPIQAVFRVR